jgi:hypothetical protein
MGTGTPPENAERSRVCTITITAPQQEHRIGARSFTQAIERPGMNFSTKCSKAIRRLQLGCRNPKLRARRNCMQFPFRQHMLQDQPQEIRTGQGSLLRLSALGLSIKEAYLTVRAGYDILFANDPTIKIAPKIDERRLSRDNGFTMADGSSN